jgi:peroxiredoxin Q/BCP
MIQIGKSAPEIVAKDQNDQPFTLSKLKGRPVIVFFFPKTESKFCTIEACSFQSEIPHFESLNVAVIGVSPDSSKRQRQFAENHRLTYRFLSDPEGKIGRAYQIPNLLGLITGRCTILIDSKGFVRATFRSELKPTAHVEAAKLALEAMDVIS